MGLQQSGKEFILIAGDDGIGLPVGIDTRSTNSLSFQLMNTLVGQIEVDGSNGYLRSLLKGRRIWRAAKHG